MPGAPSADRVEASGTYLLAAPLPPLSSHDTYFITGTMDGGGLTSDGFVINDRTAVKLQAGTVRSFNGHGVLLTNGANDTVVKVDTVEQCSGDGVRLDENAMANSITVNVTDCGNGVQLSGQNVRFNGVRADVANQQTQFAALLAGGASFNELTVYQALSNGSGGIRITGSETVGNRILGSSGISAQTAVSGRILDNGGPGIWISAPSNFVYGYNVAGNLGDGVLLEGGDCHSMTLWGIRAGYDMQTRTARPKEGSGIHVRNGAPNLNIGLTEFDASNGDSDISGARNYLGGNRDHGLLIEGAATRNIVVTLSSAGWVVDWQGNEAIMANGIYGTAVTNGANNVTIGGAYEAINVTVANQTNGAGIYFGSNTSSNLVFGCNIGHFWNSTQRKGNRYGIQIADSAYANAIGERGSPYQVAFPTFVRNYDSRNVIQGNLEAGILLEAGGDPNKTSSPGETPTGGNVIQNNWIGGKENRVGTVIRQGAEANRIGGSHPEEANQISYNTHAGIQIDGAVITRPERASRIIGNELRRNGYRVTDPSDPLMSIPDGSGISLINGARGHVIGGETRRGESHLGKPRRHSRRSFGRKPNCRQPDSTQQDRGRPRTESGRSTISPETARPASVWAESGFSFQRTIWSSETQSDSNGGNVSQSGAGISRMGSI